MADITGDNGPNVLPGTPDDDTIIGQEGNDTLTGGDGNDTLQGDAGEDSLDGGEGDDLLLGGLGNDSITGGAGIDTVSYEDISVASPIGVGVYLLRTSNHSQGDGGVDNLFGIENVIGSQVSDTVEGTHGANVLRGLGGDDLLIGHGGDDTLIGDDGEDFLRGRDGNDILQGGLSNDFLQGGEGDDTFDGGEGFDRASMGPGIPTDLQTGATVDLAITVAQDTGHGMDTFISVEHVSGSQFNDTFYGDGGANWLWGIGGTDYLDGRDGDDLIEVGQGVATVIGGNGTDTLSFNSNSAFPGGVTFSLLLQGSAQAITGGSVTATGIENLSGSLGVDTLTGDGAGNILAGHDGNDVMNGEGGDDTLYGDGAIRMVSSQGGSGPITVIDDQSTFYSNHPQVGNDTLNGGQGNDTLVGGGGDDLLNGGPGNDTIDGGTGTDTVTYVDAVNNVGVGVYLWRASNHSQGDGGVDQLIGIENVTGSTVSDTLEGNEGANVLTGLAGNDLLVGHGGDDTLVGDAGEDFLRGRDGNDIAYGGADNDFFSPGEGVDSMDGGDGYDRVSMFASLPTDLQVGATVDLAIQGVAQDTGHGMKTFISIEHVSGTSFSDTFFGNDGANWLWGAGGDDVLDGRGGDDLLQVSGGTQVLIGGDGVDSVTFADNTVPVDGVTVSLLLQGAAQDTTKGMMTLTGIENLAGSLGNDVLTGDGGGNIVAGGDGDDILDGGDGNDVLLGDGNIRMTSSQGGSGPITTVEDQAVFYNSPALSGNDVLFGGAGADRLVGGTGDDVLDGGTGNDALEGGAGRDTASFATATAGVNVFLNNLGNGSADGADGSDSLSSIEVVQGSDFIDFIRGAALGETLYGGLGEDTVRGEGGDDIVDGQGSDDFVRGGDGNDQVRGGDDNDYVHGGEGDDLIDGGAGSDRAAFTLAQATDAQVGASVDLNIQGVAQDTGHGMDTLVSIEHVSGTTFDDVLTGDAQDNWLWGQDGDDTLLGNVGDDLLEVGIGAHLVDGGADTDTLRFTVLGETPTDITFDLTLQGSDQNFGAGTVNATGIENLSGGAGRDSLTGDENANVLAGWSGDDTLSGGEGEDLLLGDGAFGVSGIGYSGEIISEEDSAAVEGDPLLSGDDLLSGGDGNDRIVAGGGTDDLHGDAGDDVLEAGGGNDLIDGGADTDTAVFTGARADYETHFEFGQLYITDLRDGAPDGTDRLVDVEYFQFSDMTATLAEISEGLPNANDDRLQTTVGQASSIDASVLLLNDAFAPDDSGGEVTGVFGADGVTVSLVDGKLVILSGAAGGSFNYTVEGDFGSSSGHVTVAAVATTAATDTVAPTGGPVAVDFQGQGGNDSLTGTDNADHLVGGAGNDTLNGGLGVDVMEGGTQNDTYHVDDARDQVIEAAAEGDDLVISSISHTLADNVERLTLTGSATYAYGNALNNTLTGTDGANLLNGGLGADLMKGGLGNDTYHVDNAGDVIQDTGGVETVVTTLNAYTLSSTTLEHLTFEGIGDFTGTGTSLANTITGGVGNDRIDGLGGADTMVGGEGDDTYVVAQSNDIVVELDGGGTDTVETSVNYVLAAFVETLTGTGSGNINLTGNDLANTILGNGGNNSLNGGLGADQMSGGLGDDTYIVDDAGDAITELAGGGFDTVNAYVSYTLSAEVERLVLLGTAANGTGNAGANNIIGNALDNVLDGGGGSDILQGGLGNDTYYVTATAGIIESGVGIDTVYANAASYTLGDYVENLIANTAGAFTGTGNTLANSITGGAQNDNLSGREGNDILDGGLGADILNGGAGNDTYVVDNAGDSMVDSAGIDTVNTTLASYTLAAFLENLTYVGAGVFTGTGNAAANTLTGGANNDTLNGLGGADILIGGGGIDTLNGDIGNDTLDGGSGADVMNGGAGDDAYVVDDLADAVNEALNGGTDTVRTALAALTLAANAEILTYTGAGAFSGTGNGLANTLNGGAGDDTLDGAGGDDKLNGGLGADTLIGGIGNDTLDGGAGADAMSGGVGNDTYTIDDAGDVITELAGEGTTDAVRTALSSLTLAENVEILTYIGAGAFSGTGNGLANTITGGAQGDTLYGLAGGDTLRGGLGGDTLYGGGDNDKLYGEAGDDFLLGEAGNDYFYGGAGADTLAGGAGKDFFILNVLSDSGVGAVLRDVIIDFDATDVLDLRLIDADTGVAADQAFSFIGTGVFTNVAGQLRYEHDAAGTHVFGDVNGDSVADFEVLLNGTIVLNSGDFLL